MLHMKVSGLKYSLVKAAVLAGCMVSGAAFAQTARDAGMDDPSRLTSAARLMAGMAPTDPAHADIARTKAWQAHSAEIQAKWAPVRDGQAAAITAWRDAKLPRTCPVGKTLLYPFSGPDFFNAWWLFPECETYVMFGLEHIGEMPAIGRMSERDLAQLFTDVRNSMLNIFERNYFVTGTMSKRLRTERLRGVVPVFAVSMALSGVEVLQVKPLTLTKSAQAAAPEPAAKGKPAAKRRLAGVTIEFRKPGSPHVQRLHYFSFDATNVGIAAYPEILEYLGSFAPATMLLKSASYLLHGGEFSRLRSVLLDTAVYLVQDDTGLPYPMLVKRGWDVEIHGRYERPIPPFEYAYQPSLAKLYAARKPDPLPFLFGYRRNVDGDRAHLMIAQLGQRPPQPDVPARKGAAAASRP